MTITSAGYYGSVDDARWAALWNNCPIWFDSSAFASSGVSGARRISLTAGIAFAAGIRDTSDGAATVDLNPPSSGGYWYLLVLRRTWVIGTGGTTSIVPLLGPSTDGSTPSAVPTGLPSGFTQIPSTTFDAPIAWVHVRAADTALTIFDCRLLASGIGAVNGASLAALVVARLMYNLGNGIQLRDASDGTIHQVFGTSWQPWESRYVGYSPALINLAFTGQACSWRHRAGLVRVKLLLNGDVSIGSGVPTMSLPVAADLSGNTKPIGRMRAVDSGSAEFPIYPEFVSATLIKWQFMTGSPARATDMTVNNLQTWDTGDLILGAFEYERTAA